MICFIIYIIGVLLFLLGPFYFEFMVSYFKLIAAPTSWHYIWAHILWPLFYVFICIYYLFTLIERVIKFYISNYDNLK